MTLAGAANETKNELVRVLRAKDASDHGSLCKYISNDLQSFNDGDTKKTLVQANAIFTQSGRKLLDTFMQIVEKDFEAMSKEV